MRNLILGILVVWSPAAFGDEPKVVYKDKTEIDFEGIELEGELVKPQGALLLERKKANFNPLIRLRKDFTLEIKQSVKDVQ